MFSKILPIKTEILSVDIPEYSPTTIVNGFPILICTKENSKNLVYNIDNSTIDVCCLNDLSLNIPPDTVLEAWVYSNDPSSTLDVYYGLSAPTDGNTVLRLSISDIHAVNGYHLVKSSYRFRRSLLKKSIMGRKLVNGVVELSSVLPYYAASKYLCTFPGRIILRGLEHKLSDTITLIGEEQ